MRNREGTRKFWKSSAVVLGLFVFWIVVFELVLQVASHQVSAIDHITNRHPPQIQRFLFNQQLELQGNPQWKEHDNRGFRNRAPLDRAAIVTLGDSHTYGLHVSAKHTWPVLLSQQLQQAVYNMGMPNYGPTHNFTNLKVALSLHPDIVLLGFYFGNDFYDSFHHVQSEKTLESFTSPSNLEAINVREAQGTIEKQSTTYFRLCRGQGEQEFLGVQATSSMRAYLSAHSRLYGLLRSAKKVVMSSIRQRKPLEQTLQTVKSDDFVYCSVFRGQSWKTILKAPYRNLALNDSDPRIRAGVDIAKSYMKRIKQEVVAAGAEFVVVLFPTKENVFASRVFDLKGHTQMEELIHNEARLKAEMIHFFETHGIAFIDVLPQLRRSPNQPYFETEDGHPNESGHQIIASEVARVLERKMVVAQQ
ncbi:MAG: SGNH/GDSL hydrolase family protein [Nitrospirae bacterium]|nr:SGNH/GDSL hydrolase family protein [Nitrospirota bacterium]